MTIIKQSKEWLKQTEKLWKGTSASSPKYPVGLKKTNVNLEPKKSKPKKKQTSQRYKRYPKWRNKKAIDTIYSRCRELNRYSKNTYEVDHIIPLNGIKVSGLHVHTNLQIILKSENVKKGNYFKID